MLQIATKEQIEQRVKALNLTMKRFAVMAGVDPMTMYRGARGLSTNARINDAIEAEELRLVDHLLSLPHVQRTLAERADETKPEAA